MADDETTGPDDTTNDLLATAKDVVGDLITGVPAPIRKNAFKAFGRLCTATIDIPVAYLEGIAEEKRAETKGRVKIISSSADQIASQMQIDPNYVRAAAKKFGQKIVREQINLDKVTEAAALDLKKDALLGVDGTPAEEAVPIDDDWLNDFEKEASKKSTEEMQKLFGRVLAGEIRRPASFSIRTVKLLSEIQKPVAELFRLFRSCCISLEFNNQILDARVASLGTNAASNGLLSYGLSFGQLNNLHEYGLIISDYNSSMDYGMSVVRGNAVALPLTHQGYRWAFVPEGERAPDAALKINGVALTVAGRELLPIVDLIPTEAYTSALHNFYAVGKLPMVRVDISEHQV